jgi:hypothetical protein
MERAQKCPRCGSKLSRARKDLLAWERGRQRERIEAWAKDGVIDQEIADRLRARVQVEGNAHANAEANADAKAPGESAVACAFFAYHVLFVGLARLLVRRSVVTGRVLAGIAAGLLPVVFVAAAVAIGQSRGDRLRAGGGPRAFAPSRARDRKRRPAVAMLAIMIGITLRRDWAWGSSVVFARACALGTDR